jgi:hypothetical protein
MLSAAASMTRPASISQNAAGPLDFRAIREATGTRRCGATGGAEPSSSCGGTIVAPAPACWWLGLARMGWRLRDRRLAVLWQSGREAGENARATCAGAAICPALPPDCTGSRFNGRWSASAVEVVHAGLQHMTAPPQRRLRQRSARPGCDLAWRRVCRCEGCGAALDRQLKSRRN